MNYDQDHNPSQGKDLILLAVLALIFVGISFIQTAIGYTELAGPIVAWLFSGVISLLLFYLNFKFRASIISRRGVWGVLLAFVLVAAFSFAGNFNSFYSRFMKKELYDQEIREYQEKVMGIRESSVKAITESSGASTVKDRVNQLKVTMISQIMNPGNPGWGERARAIADEIEEILGTKLTRVEGSYRDIARSAEYQIDEMLEIKLAELTGQTEVLVEEINAMADSMLPQISIALQPRNIETYGRNAIESGADTYNAIGEKTQGFLGRDNFPFTRIEPQNQNVGKLNHTFKSAFVDWDDPQSTLIALIISIAIDFLLPLVILLTTRTGTRKGEADENSSTGIFQGSRKPGVKVLK